MRVISQYRRHKRSKRELAAWIAMWSLVAAIGLFPQIADVIGNVFGVKSGANAVFIFAIVVLIYISLRNTFLIESLEEKVSELTRKLALQEFTGESKSDRR